MSKWFVMLRNAHRPPSPLIDDDEEVALFSSEDEADIAAEKNPLGVAFGWETYVWWVDEADLG